ncbi:TolB family protein [Butyrivibrio sp. MC2021]|uniref:TolB family protein n=1 Tax=Butyrivibrio sp. MC2021 TaxID=1408306 RepID=UPI0006870C01|nr:zinc ribbon domain-containing protein [Butyrivibrio sp. MC2021]
MFCSKCGCEIKEGDKFCGNCGVPAPNIVNSGNQPVNPMQNQPVNPIQNQPVNQYYRQQPAPAPNNNKRTLIVVLIIAAVLVMLISFVSAAWKLYKRTREIVDPLRSLYEEYEDLFEDYENYSYDYDDDDDYDYDYDEEEAEDEEKKEIEYVHVDAPKYEGDHNYFTGEKWIVAIEDLIVNSEGKSNDKLFGQDCDMATNRSFTQGMALSDEGKFYYINSDTAAAEFAPGAKCAELALDGGEMFYLIPTGEALGKNKDVNVGSLYLFDTSTGLSQKVADNVEELSPVISPDGQTIAYTRFTDSKNMVLCIAGPDKEEKQLEKGYLRACSVNNDGNLFYTNSDQTEIYRYIDGKSKKVLTCEEFNNYFVDGDLDEILVSCKDGAYYCDFEMDEAAKVYDGTYVTNMHTEAIHQAYGQFWATVLDVKSLKDLFFISRKGDVFIVNSDGKGAAVLDYNYDQVNNILFDASSRKLLYGFKGVVYESKVTDEGIENEVLYDADYVEMFYASYDFKNIWLWIEDDIYYLNDGELECVVPDYYYDEEDYGLIFTWNIEDNKLYFVEDGRLYSVYNTESSTERVSDDCVTLAKYYGKLAYSDSTGSIFVYIDGEFVEVY